MLLGLMAESANTARLEAEAQARHLAVENGRTAARMMMAEAERDALAEKVGEAVLRSAWAVCPFCGFLNRPYEQKPSADDHKESCPWRPVFAILSDGEGR